MTTNKTLSVHYVGTFDDGTEFDNSRTRGSALQVEVGAGQLIPGFEKAVSEMEVGDTKSIRIRPEEAYGPTNPTLIQSAGMHSQMILNLLWGNMSLVKVRTDNQ